MSCRVYLVRHGETEWNAQMRFQGHTDIALSERGRKQARALGERLQTENFSAMHASDLERAYETAEIIASHHGLSVYRDSAFREIDFGDWEGLTFDEIRKKHAFTAGEWWKSPYQTRVPGGESLEDVQKRCMSSLYNIYENYPEDNVLIVAHGGVVRTIICSILGIDLNQYWRLKQGNLALNIVSFPEWDKGILELFNDCNHLK